MYARFIVREILISITTVLLVANAFAGRSTRKTKVTVSESVRVPGAVLAPGTYFFEAPQQHNRTIVKISKDDGTLVTQFMGIADDTHRQNHDIIVFGEHECSPKAIKAWFYPNSGQGVRFVYSEAEASAIAAACNEPVPETHENVSDPSARVMLITPTKQEEDYTSDALSNSDRVDQKGFDTLADESNKKPE